MPARAAPAPHVLNVRSDGLPQALSELARQTGAEMLYDAAMVRNLRAQPVRGRLTAQAALSLMLAGTGLGYRETADGTFVLYRLPLREQPTGGDGAISEILVVGRRTQNADIRRTQNDIQPYKISTAQDIETAHRDNIDGYMRGRVPANADALSPMQDIVSTPGDTRSKIDLRGLGVQRTLVLVDGRRLPALPSVADFDQADLNGIPLGAIDRIETLTSTAGGIYGPSAVGGVVNVVLRRDYRGADFTATTGITTRGDAARARLEARIGFTPDGGDTDVMLFGSYAVSQPLLSGQRDYQLRARVMAYANSQADYLSPSGGIGLAPLSNTLFIGTTTGAPLTFDPQFGGASLNASVTFLPLDFPGTDADRRAALVANAGKLVLNPPTGYSGDQRSLMNNPTVISGLFNLRHRLGPDVELFLDGLYFRNDGEIRGADQPSSVFTQPDAPNNPFAQQIFFRFPNEQETTGQVDLGLYRLVGGLIVSLPSGWKAEAEFALGAASFRNAVDSSSYLSNAFFSALSSGLPGPPASPRFFRWATGRPSGPRWRLCRPVAGRLQPDQPFHRRVVTAGGPSRAAARRSAVRHAARRASARAYPGEQGRHHLVRCGSGPRDAGPHPASRVRLCRAARATGAARQRAVLPARSGAAGGGALRQHPHHLPGRSGPGQSEQRPAALRAARRLHVHDRRARLPALHAHAARQLCDRGGAADDRPAPVARAA